MARVANVKCAGPCGQLIYAGRGSLPAGRAMCRPCRAAQRRRATTATRTAQCGHCRISFEAPWTGKGWRKTCSADCRYAFLGAASVAAMRSRDPRDERVPVGSRKWRDCEICPEQFIPTYPGQRTCGRACGLALKRLITRGYPCEACGKVFEVTGVVGAPPKRCADCRRKAQAPPRVCIQCGGAMCSPGWLCSDDCREARRLRYWQSSNAKRSVSRGIRRCPCGEPTPSAQRQKCDACRDSSKRARKLYERKRSRVKSEPYTLAEIAKRDNYRCGICRKQVLMNKVVPHRRAPTIDHLIPISDEGDDVPANVQLAHFICNSIRGAGGIVQLALIG